jgi:hypothetical protein
MMRLETTDKQETDCQKNYNLRHNLKEDCLAAMVYQDSKKRNVSYVYETLA